MSYNNSLLYELVQVKKRLISEKKILDKRDKNIYPISEAPYLIPKEWTWCYLSDISIIQEGPGIRKHQYTNEGIQFLTVTNILEGDVDLKKSKKYISLNEYNNTYKHFTINYGDIVTACSGGSWGKSAMFLNNETLILNTSTLRLRFFDDLGSNKYLYYLTKTDYFKNNLSSYSTGQQPNYGYSHYSKIPIPLPPLQEQQRIVSILDEAFTAIDKAKANTEQNLKNAKELFESELQRVFSEKGDGWEEKTLGDVLQKTKTIDPTKQPEKEFVYLDVSSVNKENKEIENVTILLGKDAPSRARKGIKANDVIFATVRPTHSRVAIITDEYDGQVCSTGYFVLRAKEMLNNNLVFYFLLTNSFNKQMEKLQKGASYPAVTDSEVKSIKISFPKSLKDQKTIVSKLDALREQTKKLEAVYVQKLQDLEELKKSVLQKAFSGELTSKRVELVKK
ncbi:restriction endonuclease subunit S [Flavobacterium sp.]|uniref:restriction endonuclease subunit S n=1 Tax=Flavobacterium sp. TaxID=239 RepID=UPI00286E0FC1|nr:restriction endonuclease subunit S [Flavobacterium sp.]